LENEGIKTIYDELREYSEGKQVTFVEWAEFNQNEAPFKHVKINVTYSDEDESRIYEFISCGEDKIVEGLAK
jgi:tRNA A37 threonylcarbamoyladenosine biosynthesis protein TsaE